MEQSFSHMKMIKTRLRNRLKESSSMKIAIESPEKQSEKDLDDIHPPKKYPAGMC